MEQSQDNESFSETVNYIDQANNSRVLSCSSQLQNAPASNILSPVRKNIWMSEEGLPQHIIIDISQIKERPKFFKFVSFDCWHDYKSNPSIIEFLVSTDDKKEFITWSTFYLELKEGTQVFSIDSLGRRYNFIKILVKETFGASKTYLNSFKLFEEKPFPNKIEQQQFMSIDMKRDNSLLHDQAQMEDHDTSGTYFQGVRSQATNYSLAINSNVPNTINTMQTQANQTLPDLLIGFTSVNSQNNTPQVKNNNNMSSNNSERRIKHNSINKIKQISPTQEKPNYFPLPRVGHLQNSHSSKSKSNMANNSYSDVRQFNLPTPTENQKNKHSSSFHAYQQSGFQVKQNHFNGSGDEYSIQSEQEANKRLFSAERQQQSSQQQYLNSHESKHENEILNQGQHQKQVVSHMYQEKQDNQFIKQRGINQSISIPTQQVEPFFLPNTPSAVIIQQHNSINQGFVPQQQQQQQHMSYQISSNSKVQNEVSYQTQNIRNQNQIGFEGPEQFNNLFQNHQFMQNHTRMSQPQDRGNNNPPLILTQSEREIMNMKIIVGELKQEIIQKDQRISNQDERIEQLERAIHSLLQRTSALEATLDLMDTSTVIQQQFNKNQEQNKEEDVFHTSQKQQLPLNSPQTFGKYQQNNYGIKQISADYSPDHSNEEKLDMNSDLNQINSIINEKLNQFSKDIVKNIKETSELNSEIHLKSDDTFNNSTNFGRKNSKNKGISSNQSFMEERNAVIPKKSKRRDIEKSEKQVDTDPFSKQQKSLSNLGNNKQDKQKERRHKDTVIEREGKDQREKSRETNTGTTKDQNTDSNQNPRVMMLLEKLQEKLQMRSFKLEQLNTETVVQPRKGKDTELKNKCGNINDKYQIQFQ